MSSVFQESMGWTFPPDFKVEFRGQIYVPVAIRDHQKKDGEIIQVIDWNTACPNCGAPFAIFTTMTFTKPRRRCDTCKAPGRRVRKRKHVPQNMPTAVGSSQ